MRRRVFMVEKKGIVLGLKIISSVLEDQSSRLANKFTTACGTSPNNVRVEENLKNKKARPKGFELLGDAQV